MVVVVVVEEKEVMVVVVLVLLIVASTAKVSCGLVTVLAREKLYSHSTASADDATADGEALHAPQLCRERVETSVLVIAVASLVRLTSTGLAENQTTGFAAAERVALGNAF